MSQSSILHNDVWQRTGGVDTLSRRVYLFEVCAWVAAGIAVSAYVSTISEDWNLDVWGAWSTIGFMFGVLAVAIMGVYISSRSDNVAVSAFGYALVAGPFGLLLGPFMAMYETSSVVKVFALTCLVVVVLGIVGAMIPNDLAPWGLWLFGGLLLLIVGYLALPLLSLVGIPVEGAMTWLDWLGLLIFGGLVIFDLNRAVRLPYTHNNAVDSAVAIYLDFINIFIRLLALMGQRSD